MTAVVLVEGPSDRAAVEALAERRGRDLPVEGVAVVVLDGATAVGAALERLDPAHTGLRTAGLCDEAEEPWFAAALERAGMGHDLDRADLERIGFFTCVVDLEDELVRAAGVELAETLLDAEGDLRSFRRFQAQPAWRGRRAGEQLRRFIGTRSGRKERYARLLVEAVDETSVPRPLDGVLAYLRRPDRRRSPPSWPGSDDHRSSAGGPKCQRSSSSAARASTESTGAWQTWPEHT